MVSSLILRHLTRWPLRSGMTVTGIALALALLISSMHWFDAIEFLIETDFFRVQRQDVTVALVEPRSHSVLSSFKHLPGVLQSEPYRAVPVRWRFGHRSRLGNVTGLVADPRLYRVLDVTRGALTLPVHGLLLSAELAGLLGAKVGDRVTVEILEGRRPIRDLRVADIFKNYLGTPAFMHIDALNRLMLENTTVSGAHLVVDPNMEAALYRDLKDTPQVASVTLRKTTIRAFRETLAESLNTIIFFYVLFAALMAFGVVYNNVRIALSERRREFASLRVMGFTRGEVSYILLGELALLAYIALPLGCLLGYGLSRLMTVLFETELFRIPMVIEPATYGFSVAVIFAAVSISAVLVRRRIDHLDLIAVLKTRE